jgi:hypothetical protein
MDPQTYALPQLSPIGNPGGFVFLTAASSGPFPPPLRSTAPYTAATVIPAPAHTKKTSKSIAPTSTHGSTKHINGSNPLFSSIPIDTGDGGPNLLPYDELRFPRLDRGAGHAGVTGGIVPAAAAEMDSMWVMGFLDSEDSHVRAQNREYATYERMFRVKGPQTMAIEAEAAAAARAAEASGGSASAAASKEKRSFLSGAEIARIRELELQTLEEKARKGPTLADRVASSAYVKENAKIRKALALRGEVGARKLKKLYRPAPKLAASSAMDNLLFLERLESQAAVVLQRAYRRYRRMVFWRRYLYESKMATLVQRIWRGHRARNEAKKWKKQREMLALKIQAAQRGRNTRQRMQDEKQFQAEAAEDIQRVWRGHRMRRRAQQRMRKKSAIKIQRLWRGMKGRALADRQYLSRCAIAIQRNVRKWLVRKRYLQQSSLEGQAVTKIQTIFRGWRIRRLRNQLLWERDTAARTQWMAIMKAEELHLDKELNALIKVRHGQLKQLICT